MNQEEGATSIERREHMFDKVVTPSDVGKLNRLVIPKQYAESYFPLHNSSTNGKSKAVVLNFEDLEGNSWRFRYSHWTSSQSYVMTKGWSRFVKEKKLDAGDIVSFQRDSTNKEKFFIDWRRRPKIPDHHYQPYHQFSGAMFPMFYSFPQPHNLYHGYYYVRNPTPVIESVPRRAQVAAMASRGGKRLRLFGVDMECGGGEGGSIEAANVEDNHSFTKKGKSSLSLDLDR